MNERTNERKNERISQSINEWVRKTYATGISNAGTAAEVLDPMCFKIGACWRHGYSGRQIVFSFYEFCSSKHTTYLVDFGLNCNDSGLYYVLGKRVRQHLCTAVWNKLTLPRLISVCDWCQWVTAVSMSVHPLTLSKDNWMCSNCGL